MNETALKMSDAVKDGQQPANDVGFGEAANDEGLKELERQVARYIIEGGLLKPGMRFWRGPRLILVGHDAFKMDADAPDPAWVKMLGSDVERGRDVRLDLGYVGNLGLLLALVADPQRAALLTCWAADRWPVGEVARRVAGVLVQRAYPSIHGA